ncbi:MAG: uroporphyrinogen-III C-methyltransferase [gamma proteobacterium symbiont of Bathyaustriella thionipta]|nr:uroporphyrinogen-III C-methyltransferase [gamma proteobacterium symbiont of Bathyaustriella thionipta]
MTEEKNSHEDEHSEAPLTVTESLVEEAETVVEEPAEQPQPSSLSDDSIQKRARPPSGLILSLLALLAVMMGVSGFFAWQRLQSVGSDLAQVNELLRDAQSKNALMLEKIASARNSINEQQQRFRSMEQRYAEQKKLMESESRTTRESLAKVYERVGREKADWQVAEAEYLLQIANHRLKLERDSSSARHALLSADERLRELGDPLWFDVRKQIAAEISALDQVKKLDIEGYSARLSALSTDADTLYIRHLENDSAAAHESDKTTAEESESGTLDRLMQDSWQGFQKLVVIRRHDQPLNALLSADQQYFVRQNLKFHLQAARFALLRADQALYQESLDAASGWLQEYFDQSDAAVQADIDALKALKKLNVAPPLPDISASLRVLKQQREEIQAQGSHS